MPITGVRTLAKRWDDRAQASEPRMTERIFGPTMTTSIGKFTRWLAEQPSRPFVVASDSIDETLAFPACLFRQDGVPAAKRDLAAVFASPETLAPQLPCHSSPNGTADFQIQDVNPGASPWGRHGSAHRTAVQWGALVGKASIRPSRKLIHPMRLRRRPTPRKVHRPRNIVDGESGSTEESSHLDHAQAREELLDEVGFLVGQVLSPQEPMERPSVRAGLVAGEVVGGQGVKILVGVPAGVSPVRVGVREPGEGHRRHAHHVLRAASALESSRALAGAADEGAVLSHAFGPWIDAAFPGLLHALALEGRDALFDGRHVVVRGRWGVVGAAYGFEVDHGAVP